MGRAGGVSPLSAIGRRVWDRGLTPPARRGRPDAGHGVARRDRHGAAWDKKGLPSATWGFSRGLGHRWLKSARSLCCPQRDKRARNPSFLLKNSQDFFGMAAVFELGIEPGAERNLLVHVHFG